MKHRPIRLTLLLVAFLLALAALPASPAAAADLHPFDLPDGFVQEVLARDLGPATAFALRPDGSILIARKHGSVKVWRDGQVLEAPFIDLSDQVNIYGDRGLMGIAVHPDFPRLPYVYLAYAYEPEDARGHAESGARTARVVRVAANPANLDQAQPGSLVVLLGQNGAPEYAGDLDRGDRPPYSCMAAPGDAASAPLGDCLPVDGPSHTVDGLAFGPDGSLYVSAGDGTLQPDLNVRAQNLDSLAGKVLRIDPLSGAGYPDNPFYDGDPHSNRSKVYALGLRNPYRFTFDPDGVLVVGDVGGERWEEINRGGAGANFGWPCREGSLPNSSVGACAGALAGEITAAWHGYAHAGGYSAAIGGDFYTGEQFPAAWQGAYFFADHNRAALLYLPAGATADSAAQTFATNVIAPVQITQGPDGNLYVLSFVDGALSRIRYTGAGGTAEGAAAAQPTPALEQAPEAAGSAPQVTILAPAAESTWPEGTTVELAGAAEDAEDGSLSGDRLQWTATLHHNDHVHPDFFHGSGAQTQLVFEPHGPNVYLEVCLAATDSDDQAGRACVNLRQCGAASNEPCAALPADTAPTSTPTSAAAEATPTPTAPPIATAAATPSVVDEKAGSSAPAGGVRRALWHDIDGAAVAALVADGRFPDQPDAVELLPALESSGLGKDYGERLTGWLLPPVSGPYRFWIAADDSAELWLSTSADPADVRRIAFTADWTARRQWDKYADQASAPIVLEAGARYYIEVRHKQADQKDNLAVAWQPPGGEREIIGAEFLAPD